MLFSSPWSQALQQIQMQESYVERLKIWTKVDQARALSAIMMEFW